MSNSYFRFKEFTVHQENCANKVSTDACVFGVFVGKFIANKTVLDIGCGSALLSLILAQANARHITGVEIDEKCAAQAKENIKNSVYSNLIDIIQADITEYAITTAFDWIVSNPPFFNNSYQSSSEIKNKARQTESLSPTHWSDILQQKTCENSKIALLLSNNDVFEDYKTVLHETGFTKQKVIELFDTKEAVCKRVILLASKKDNLPEIETTFTYKNADGTYTADFAELLKPYYLYL